MDKPILILQMQRMGDLVLSFPLLGWLKSIYPDTPIWIVGEKAFFEGLVELSPPATYFSYSDSPALERESYSMVLNLSHRSEAAALAGRVKAEKRIGPFINNQGSLHVSGAWQLYRSSISHNNRHNLFHWADLNAMDIVPQRTMLRTSWSPVKAANSGTAPRIGLFVGASEPDKRPEPEFWAGLAKKLLQSGAKPIFLGGEADSALAARAANIIKAPAMNLSGRFSIIQLCHFISELDLLIVPDTGPMHIAAWTGVPVLNLSIGPVNPWETGPMAPGHHVLRPSPSCTGCWSCTQKTVLCKERLKAEEVAKIASLILDGSTGRLSRHGTSSGYIYRTRRDDYGLFDLQALNSGAGEASLRLDIASFWKLFFSTGLGFIKDAGATADMNRKVQKIHTAGLGKALLDDGQKMLMSLSRAIQGRESGGFKTEDYWLSFHPLTRPLSSYIQFMLHNGDFSHQALSGALELSESFIAAARQA